MSHHPVLRIFSLALLFSVFLSNGAFCALLELRQQSPCQGKTLMRVRETLALVKDAERTVPLEKGTIRRVGPTLSLTEYCRKELEEKDIPFDSEEFIRRVQQGDRDIVSLFLMAQMNPNTCDEDGTPALIWAVRSRDLEVARVLVWKAQEINAGAKAPMLKVVDINAANKDGETALLAAVKDGRVDFAEFLLKEGADVNTRSKSRDTALMLAAKAGDLEMAKLLLKEGADVNARNTNGETALTVASEKERREVAEFLSANTLDASFQERQREWIRRQKEECPSKIYIPLSWRDTLRNEFITERFNGSIERPAFTLAGYREVKTESNGDTTEKWIPFAHSKETQSYVIDASMTVDNTQKLSCINEGIKKELGNQIGLSYSEAGFHNLGAVLGEHKVEGISLIFHGARYGGIDSIVYMDFVKENPYIILSKPFISDRFITCWEYYIEKELAPRLDGLLKIDGLCEHLQNCRPDPSIGVRFGRDFLGLIPYEIDEEHRVLVLW